MVALRIGVADDRYMVRGWAWYRLLWLRYW